MKDNYRYLLFGKALYPDLLKDVDPYAIDQECVNQFFKLPNLDVKKDGIFIYPELAN
jgi:iron complex transport system substrate-binding protein